MSGPAFSRTFNLPGGSTTVAVVEDGLVSNVRGVTGIWRGTQAEYNAISAPVATVLYLITD